jgi:hypothetical protein
MDNIPEFLRGDYRDFAGQVAGLQAPEYYGGNQIAGQNQWQTGALQGMNDWGQAGGQGYQTAEQMYGAGGNMLAQGSQGMSDFLANQQINGANQFQYDQGTFDQSFANQMGGMQNMFDTGANQIQQSFDWGAVPGLNMSNALGGGQGNSMAFRQGALGQMGADQNIAQFGAGMINNATGVAGRDAMTAGGYNLGSENAFDQNQFRNFSAQAGMGADLLGTGFNMGQDNLGMGLDAGNRQFGYDQSVIDAEKAKWDYNQNLPMRHLSNQMGMIPGPGGYTPAGPQPSPWAGALNGASMGMGLYGAGVDSGLWGGGGGGGGSVGNAYGGQDTAAYLKSLGI